MILLRVQLGEELYNKIEKRISHTITGISTTLDEILSENEVTVDEIMYLVSILQPSFRILSKKWVLEILYTLLISGPLSFTQLKRILKVNQSSLSLKLKELEAMKFVERKVLATSNRNVIYNLTEKGKNTALLSIPLLYYISKEEGVFEKKRSV